ncbi:class D sortase [Alkalihalobacillus oceani]|uniref:Class D sortase n=1 Tax=Halalkalibacter oceani TaxID=1653776 RepID=A0A9X2IQ90_9BACI|nr:class D sortase [Halalkalibacter oceani]MCM3715641.1 class D sortase [Halalkalibacter oceani]
MRNSQSKLIIGIWLLLVGFILILIPFLSEWQSNRDARALEEALSLVADSEQSNIEVNVMGKTMTENELEQVMRLEIPVIDLNQLVLPETTEQNLKVALTQIKKEQVPGEGNFTIAGHRGYRAERHFSRLPEIDKGDTILLHANDKTYKYQVFSTEIIEPTYLEILEDHPFRREITLITCTRGGQERIAVRGTLMNETAALAVGE